jgi:hypothetical protein
MGKTIVLKALMVLPQTCGAFRAMVLPFFGTA